MTLLPPDPSSPGPQGKAGRSLPIGKRPASVWVLIALQTLSIIVIVYFTIVFYKAANAPTSYADSSETWAGLTFSWMGSLLEDGMKFFAVVILVPLLLEILGLLVAGLIGILRGRRWSLILVRIFAGQLVACSTLLLYFGVLVTGLVTLAVAVCMLVSINLPETKKYLK